MLEAEGRYGTYANNGYPLNVILRHVVLEKCEIEMMLILQVCEENSRYLKLSYICSSLIYSPNRMTTAFSLGDVGALGLSHPPGVKPDNADLLSQ